MFTKLTGTFIASLLLVAPSAFATTYQLSCMPAGNGATATFAVVADVTRDVNSGSGLIGTAVMNMTLQNTDGSAPVSAKNVQVRGQIEDASDANNSNATYKVLFAQPVAANSGVTYSRIAIGDADTSDVANSYIRDGAGVYYYAHCQIFSGRN